ncbi:hypothetical protein yfred0001_28750 [Yersinia frederiksenii ATCC 33641]|nr:hypothetical protein yfred0001_28750 [Yersinia frederiksenii ATCC 33641]
MMAISYTVYAEVSAMKHFQIVVERSTFYQKTAIFGHLEV